MRYFLFCVTLLLFLFSCKEEPKKAVAPADLIDQAKFTEVLTDIRILEGAYATKYARVDTSAYKIESYYKSIFEKHGIQRDQFLVSYYFYAADQQRMLDIEAAVLDKLTNLQASQDSSTVKQNQTVMEAAGK